MYIYRIITDKMSRYSDNNPDTSGEPFPPLKRKLEILPSKSYTV